LNGAVDKMLAQVRQLRRERGLDIDPEAAERWRRTFWVPLLESADRIIGGAPEDLQDAVEARIVAALQSCQRFGMDGFDDGLLHWAEQARRRDAVPVPAVLPRALVQAYLDDPQAMPFHECGECGLQVPTDRQRQVEHFPECPVCGGRTGLLAWHRAIWDAVRLLPGQLQRQLYQGEPADSPGALDLLQQAGYQLHTPLSEWVEGRRGRGEAKG
jgi:hypothetical protein